jgi:hypothetical protein
VTGGVGWIGTTDVRGAISVGYIAYVGCGSYAIGAVYTVYTIGVGYVVCIYILGTVIF